MFAFFNDGSHMGFDKRQKDKPYAALLENTLEVMASHQIKCFFRKLLCLWLLDLNFLNICMLESLNLGTSHSMIKCLTTPAL